MLPFLGRGDKGAERGVKLALIGTSINIADINRPLVLTGIQTPL